MGQSPPSKDCNEQGDGYPFYQGNAEFGPIYPNPQKWCSRPKKLADERDILISVRAPVGEINIAPHKCCIGRGIAAVKAKNVHNKFLYQSMLLHRKALQKIAQGSTFEAINRKELSELLILLPLLPEQKRIAEILTTVDEVIEKTSQIIEKTKEVKKCLMQRLLTRGIGHTKFKKTEIGEIPEEWRVLKGTDLAVKITKGSSPKWQGYEYQDDGMLFITSENVRDGFLDVSNPKFLPIEFHNRLRASQLQKGDILINIVGASIGRACVFKGEYKDANINQAVCLFRAKEGIEPIFILNYLQLPKTIHRLLETQAGSARQNLSLADINHFPFLLAPFPEQKRITAILSPLDEQIEKESNHKGQLEILKKGLMQVLLTGKLRVAV